MSEPRDYYVYLHSFSDLAFYVGKGRHGRAWTEKGRSRYWQRVREKYGPPVVTIVSNELTAPAAFEAERALIASMRAEGRRMINLTMGGEGALGFKLSKKRRRALAQTRREFVAKNPDAVVEMVARLNAPEARAKLNAHIRSPEERAARSRRSSDPAVYRHLLAPEIRAKIAATKRTPENRQATAKATRRAWADPEAKARRSAAIKSALSDQDRRRKISEAKKRFWATADRQALGRAVSKGRKHARENAASKL